MRHAVLLIALLLCSCAGTSEITGEVYVFTEGRDTVKLSGSQVFLHPMDAATIQAVSEIARTSDVNAAKSITTLQTVTADADGRFKFVAPSGRYAVSVMEARSLPSGKREFYHWLVPVDSPGNITLNNSNLHNLTP